RVDQIAPGMPVMITGDFNASEVSSAYRHLLGTMPGQTQTLYDAYRIVHPVRQPDERTHNGFVGTTEGRRIDLIVHDDQVTPIDAAINRYHVNGRYPSDHYPVQAW